MRLSTGGEEGDRETGTPMPIKVGRNGRSGGGGTSEGTWVGWMGSGDRPGTGPELD